MTVSNLIRDLREARSLSRLELARKANVGRVNLWAYETGRNVPGIATLQKISEALGVGVGRLLAKSDSEMLLEHPLVGFTAKLLPRLTVQHRQQILNTLQAA